MAGGAYLSLGFLYASLPSGLRYAGNPAWACVLLWPGEIVSTLIHEVVAA